MDSNAVEPLRCPRCGQIVVSRKFPHCTNCGETLPAAWIMTEAQRKEVETLDRHAAAQHEAQMKFIQTMPSQDLRRG
jgi:hypothetical protein